MSGFHPTGFEPTVFQVAAVQFISREMRRKRLYNIVFESPQEWHRWLIKGYLKRGFSVFVVEPFSKYHHDPKGEKGTGFSPPSLPAYIEDLLQRGKISLLKATDLRVRDIYPIATDNSVEVIEKVFPVYLKRHKRLIGYVCDTLRSPVAEGIFSKNLCNRLAVFYSVNIMLHRIEQAIPHCPIKVYTSINPLLYHYLKKLLINSGQKIFEHNNIIFPFVTYAMGVIEKAKQHLITMTRLLAKMALSILRNKKITSSPESRKSYRFGITIITVRQLEENKRGPDFIVDDKKILYSDVVYFPLVALSEEQKKRLLQLKSDVFYISNKEGNSSHFPSWKRLLLISLKEKFLRNTDVVSDAYLALAEYFTWQRLMSKVEIKHFITHCDMGAAHIPRNIALEQSGVQTWYFTDSMNLGLNMCQNGNKSGERHPFWTYLYYDHLVVWHEILANFYADHPGSFKQIHEVGCLWGDHIADRKSVMTGKTTKSKVPFTILFFDSSYALNTRTSYEEGVAFARHLLQLADEYPDIMIVLKEKKKRTIHTRLDPLLGPRLLALYEKMDTHSRVKTFIDKFDSSNLISIADMVVSFPFTSTTFEALSVNKPAIWHDPLGYYRNTPYGNVGGVTTHNYEELKKKILEIKGMEPGTFQNPIPMDSPLMDPYRDGKAIDRFRDLLVSS